MDNQMNWYEPQTDLLKALSHSTRLAILDILREGEQCVCHLEASLVLRQAYISQQLMILKQAGLLESRRDGLNLYYRVIRPEVFDVLDALRAATGILPEMADQRNSGATCPCPKCKAPSENKLVQISLPGRGV
jgi:DNA-binding transcriptional ArsR family regulator